MAERFVVLDTGAVLTRPNLLDPAVKYVCPGGVVAEVKDKGSRGRFETFDAFWEERNADTAVVKAVKARAALTGEDKELSDVDVQVVALGLMMAKGEGLPLLSATQYKAMASSGDYTTNPALDPAARVCVWSSDRALRNLCFALGVPSYAVPSGRQTSDLTVWKYECAACHSAAAKSGCAACGGRRVRRAGFLVGPRGVLAPLPWKQ